MIVVPCSLLMYLEYNNRRYPKKKDKSTECLLPLQKSEFIVCFIHCYHFLLEISMKFFVVYTVPVYSEIQKILENCMYSKD